MLIKALSRVPEPDSEDPTLVHPNWVMKIGTFTNNVQVSTLPPAKKRAGQIKKESMKKRITNIE
ncbi:hypothetical protein D1AOALGA4SA_10823 [Olavius algarvensis Delta 1 endosymbiont]|nr:hypothetical protein D1AOALGA4SA_10823 [Olavius algarvensis Delta 1 endosymbiont]